jgi:serine/threonine protein kinase
MNAQNKNKIVECYQIIETIGKGANGLVHKGINLNNGMFVAMKEMPISKEEVKAIKKEINFIKNLNHKNIVKYFDAVLKDHKIYLIL